MISVQIATGAQARNCLPTLAQLRIQVFRQWPYLYDGDLGYEESYLQTYAQSPRAVFVLARDGESLVGCATGVPLSDEPDYCQAPFKQSGIAIESVFYFGESVLLPSYRGKGLGHRFFDAREHHARQLGFTLTAFCAVVRSADDPRRPENARTLEPFWRGRGYSPQQGMRATFSWRELGCAIETPQEMQFWLRRDS